MRWSFAVRRRRLRGKIARPPLVSVMAGLAETGQPLGWKLSFYILWSSAPLVQREKPHNVLLLENFFR
jgi:hypothetical protein